MRRHLIVIFSLDDKNTMKDIDIAILHAIMKGKFSFALLKVLADIRGPDFLYNQRENGRYGKISDFIIFYAKPTMIFVF